VPQVRVAERLAELEERAAGAAGPPPPRDAARHQVRPAACARARRCRQPRRPLALQAAARLGAGSALVGLVPGRSGGWTATMLPAGAHWPPGGTVWAYMPAHPVQVPLGAAGATQWAWAPLRNDAAELGAVPPAWTAAAPPNLAESAAAAAREMPHRVGGAWPAATG